MDYRSNFEILVKVVSTLAKVQYEELMMFEDTPESMVKSCEEVVKICSKILRSFENEA